MSNRLSCSRPRLAVVMALLISAAMASYHLGIFLPWAMERRIAQGVGNGYFFGNDFYPIWLTSREALLRHRNPYDPSMTREIQTGLFGHPLGQHSSSEAARDYRAFAYPAFTDLLFWPFSLLPFPVVRIGITTALAALTALSIPLWLRAMQCQTSSSLLLVLILFTLSSYAVIEGLFAGQAGLLVGFLLAAALASLARGRMFLAGSLFAFTLIKPQMSALVAIYLLLWSFKQWRERCGFTYGLLGWSGLLIGSSLIVWPHWIAQWLGVLYGYRGYSVPPLLAYSLGGRLGSQLGPILTAMLLLVALMVAWRLRRVPVASPLFMLTVSLLLAITSITLLPGHAVYDHIVLLPGILVIASTWREFVYSSRAFAVILAAGALALFWQWLAAIPLLGIRYLLSPAHFYSNMLFLVPFHAAASVPLAITAILGCMMWKVMRRQAALTPTGKALQVN